MIKIGIGGWTFEPWRGVFYPEKLAQSRELQFASQNVTSIEINGTFYGTQKPASFRKWADETPDDFIFSLKAVRYAVNRRVLAEAGESIERFIGSGISELKSKLGPILWQFAPTKQFDEEDFTAFVKLLPKDVDGLKLRHALEVRHDSFKTKAFVDLARKHNCAIVYADSDKHPAIADVTADFIYARLQNAEENITTGYSKKDLDAWAKRAQAWESGASPADLPCIADKAPPKKKRDVFIYMINGAKVRAPAAAMELIKRVS